MTNFDFLLEEKNSADLPIQRSPQKSYTKLTYRHAYSM